MSQGRDWVAIISAKAKWVCRPLGHVISSVAPPGHKTGKRKSPSILFPTPPTPHPTYSPPHPPGAVCGDTLLTSQPPDIGACLNDLLTNLQHLLCTRVCRQVGRWVGAKRRHNARHYVLVDRRT